MCCTACCPQCDKMATWCQTKCSERMIQVLNLLACAMILVCVAFRFVYMADGSLAFFFIVLSVYLAAFTIALVLAEFKVEKVRVYINFLDSKFGRGAFMIFLALLILENRALEIILFLCICAIGVFNMIIGCKQGSDGKKALAEQAKEREEQKQGQSAQRQNEQQISALERAEQIRLQNERNELQKQESLSQLKQDAMRNSFTQQQQQQQYQQQHYQPQQAYNLEEVDRQYYGRGSAQRQQQYYQNDSQQQIDNHMIEINLNDDDNNDDQI